jgi:hypothetical protein
VPTHSKISSLSIPNAPELHFESNSLKDFLRQFREIARRNRNSKIPFGFQPKKCHGKNVSTCRKHPVKTQQKTAKTRSLSIKFQILNK